MEWNDTAKHEMQGKTYTSDTETSCIIAKTGDIILDTHVGSASSLIACYNTGHKFVGFELDKYYYDLSKKRLDEEMAQMNIKDFI